MKQIEVVAAIIRKAVIEQGQSDAGIHETMGFWWTGFDRSTIERITELQPGEI